MHWRRHHNDVSARAFGGIQLSSFVWLISMSLVMFVSSYVRASVQRHCDHPVCLWVCLSV